ncbi:histidine phosphatase family protein [Psychrobacter sp.]|uniref:histidine phosphatase family protein n=1 Tax=Psychrobacter sp. TaxID=56811 RepID=UPI002647F762|nr:histidine phosphatase family protein [Psychrobacter sp.]MDN6276218.1 histidine phosphatase family protein [Psychrobacter sp.]MDN6308784.1 histidine phosphatase family protein [Psychrobacter sp.]
MSKHQTNDPSKQSTEKLASHIPTAPAPSHLPESMISSVSLLPDNKRLILFTRHSLRERSDGNGFASEQLPLTPKGRVLAQSWGRWLAGHLPYSLDVDSISSPISRCIDTAHLMQAGAGLRRDVAHQSLLVEPGSLVTEPEIANPIFKEIGVLNFINRFLRGNLEGTKNCYQGGIDILSLFYQNQPQQGHLMLAVSHDTLLSAFLAVMFDIIDIDWNDWPKMMEGVFLWFDDNPFEQANAHFIWRGEIYIRPVSDLLEGYRASGFPTDKLLLPPDVKWR